MLQVRETTYRGEDGFLICGRPKELGNSGFPVSIFVHHRAVAEDIRDRMKAAEDPSLLEYYDSDGNLMPKGRELVDGA